MAEKPTDSPLSFLLENYISLRDMYRRELLPGKSKIYDSLELLRIIFVLTQLTKFEEGFQKMFEDILDKMKITNFSWHDIVQVEESIKNYFYGILKEKDGSSSVRLRFSKRKSDCPDYPFLNIPEQKLPDLLSNCEESILRLVKAHQTQKESEQDPVKREKHSFQCVICLNEKALIDIFDGGRPFYPTPIQDVEEGAPAFDDTLYGLDGGLAEPEGKSPEPTPVKIWPKEGVESDDLTTTDLMDGKIDPTDPSTENALYEKNEARNNKQLSEVEEQSNKGVDDELENVEDRDDKEENAREGDENVQLKEENAALVHQKEEFDTQLEAAQNELALPKGSQSNPNYKNMVKISRKNRRRDEEYWARNEERIRQTAERKKRNWALTYYDVSTKQIEVELFHKEQVALNWVYQNTDRLQKDEPFINIRKLRNDCDPGLMTNDFKNIDIAIVHPLATETKEREGEIRNEPMIISKGKGLFDTGADVASVPYSSVHGTKERLVYSMEIYNGEYRPVVYCKLMINGVLLPKIYPIYLEDLNWRAIGNPQVDDMNTPEAEKIMKSITNKILTPKRYRP